MHVKKCSIILKDTREHTVLLKFKRCPVKSEIIIELRHLLVVEVTAVISRL